MSKKTQSGSVPNAWQQQAVAQFHAIETAYPEAVQVLGEQFVPSASVVFVGLRVSTTDMSYEPGGLRLLDNEDFVVAIPPSPFSPPHVLTPHTRFAGYAHVLEGQRLCIYLDPDREWNPSSGMASFLDRLCQWLTDAAAARFDAATAMFHPVGGVLHRTPGTPTVVVREALPGEPIQLASLRERTRHRYDLTFSAGEPLVPVLTLASGLLRGAGSTLPELLKRMDESTWYGSSSHWGLGPRPSRGVLVALAACAAKSPDGSQQYFTLAVPHPSGGPAHLLVGRLPAQATDQLRQLVQMRRIMIDISAEDVGKNTPIEWCAVSDERPEVSRRRDELRPVNAFQGKTVHVWGCGGLGSWVGEFITRAGATKVSLCDSGTVTGGLLVRQDYTETDVGRDKVEALAARLRAINDNVDVVAVSGRQPSDAEDMLSSADVIIDATVNIAVGQRLAALAAKRRGRALLAQMATDTMTGTLGILSVSAADDPRAPEAIDAAAWRIVQNDSTLEAYFPLWQEPLDGHEITPTRGCSLPTFHGSAADLAAVAACLVTLLGKHLSTQLSGTHLIALPFASSTHHRFIEA